METKQELRERFDRVVRVKSGLGWPFTMEDVAETMRVPAKLLMSSWLVPLANEDVIRKVGTTKRRDKKSDVTLWQGPYYLDLEAEEEAERQAELDAHSKRAA